MKNEAMAEEIFYRNNYFVNYIRDVYMLDQAVGKELMQLNNSFIENMMKKAGIKIKEKT